MPASILSVDVFPQPDGPSSASRRPSEQVRLRSRTAFTASYHFHTCSIRMLAMRNARDILLRTPDRSVRGRRQSQCGPAPLTSPLGRLPSRYVQAQDGKGKAIAGPEWLRDVFQVGSDLRLCLGRQTTQDRRNGTGHLSQEPPVRIETRESPDQRHLLDVGCGESRSGDQLMDTPRVTQREDSRRSRDGGRDVSVADQNPTDKRGPGVAVGSTKDREGQ